MTRDITDKVTAAFGLGTPSGEAGAVARGAMGEVSRLVTDRGTWPVVWCSNSLAACAICSAMAEWAWFIPPHPGWRRAGRATANKKPAWGNARGIRPRRLTR